MGNKENMGNVQRSPQKNANQSAQRVNVNNLKMTLNALLEEKRTLQQRIKQNSKNEDMKFDLDILNNNIDTLQKRI